MINIIEEFFIAIGGISLFLIDFFKNFSLKEIEIEKTKDINQNIAQKLNLQKDIKLQNNEKDSIDKIRRLIIPYLTNKKIIGLLGLLFLLINLFISLEISGIYIVLVLMTYIFIFH